MDNIYYYLDYFKYKLIKNIKDFSHNKMEEYDNQRTINDLNNKIKTKGYAWSVSDIDHNKICNKNVLLTKFPIFIRIYTWNKIHMEDIHVGDMLDTQNDWVDYLEFDYEPTDSDWKDTDEDDLFDIGPSFPLEGKSIILVNIYYQISPPPKEGSSLKCFDKNGNIENWTVKDGKLYCENKYFAKLEEWDSYKLFVIS